MASLMDLKVLLVGPSRGSFRVGLFVLRFQRKTVRGESLAQVAVLQMLVLQRLRFHVHHNGLRAQMHHLFLFRMVDLAALTVRHQHMPIVHDLKHHEIPPGIASLR